MKYIIAAVLFASVSPGLLFAHPRRAPSTAPGVAETLKQLEQDFGDAMKALDIDKLNQILADDWRSVGYAGKISSKQSFLSNLQSGKTDRLKSFEIGPMDVKVLGSVAVVQGTVTETRIADGKENFFKGAWMDVFEKRGERWVVVRSQSAKLP